MEMSYTVEPLNRGHFGTSHFLLYGDLAIEHLGAGEVSFNEKMSYRVEPLDRDNL